MNQDEMISGKEAAKMLRVSYSHLYTLIDRGLLHRVEEATSLKKHAPLRFRRAQVERLASEQDKETSFQRQIA